MILSSCTSVTQPEDCLGVAGGAAIEDECGVCDGDGSSCAGDCGASVCLDLDGGNLNYSSSIPIAGFQFNHNGCGTGASGGDAAAAGFTISTSGTAVLAFSNIGLSFPNQVDSL